MQANLRLIGDVHGKYKKYHQLLRKAKNTLQIGDFGFQYDTLVAVDAKRHRIIGGNHDNYGIIERWPHFLGNHGIHTVEGFGDIFFVRGAYSIDRDIRTTGVSWWEEEELTLRQCHNALKEYKRVKPNFVVTHSCPLSVIPHVTSSLSVIKSRTSQLLEEMFSVHQPNNWIFGHFHRKWEKLIDGTHFRCLNELECLDF